MIKLSKPYITDQCISNVVEVLRSGNLVQGQFVNQLENDVKSYLGVKHAFAVSSGTAALHLALIVLGIGPGDEVIVPAFTFPATANVVELVGATTVLVDINLDDFCIDTSKIEQAITPKTKAIMPVHEFGQAAKMDDIIQLAQKYNLNIVEDAACALGAEFGSKKVGTFGELGCFSLHPRKAITSGEGGILVTNKDDIAEKVAMYRNHGIVYKDSKLDFEVAGLNYRLTDFQAALCIPQLEMLTELIECRIKQANFYNDFLGCTSNIKTPVVFDNRKMVFQTYHILLSDDINRDLLIATLKEHEIEVNFGAQALNALKYYSNKYSYKYSDCPNAFRARVQGLALPLGMHLNDADIKYISSTIKKVLCKY